LLEVICNTSPLQYLHQIDQLEILPALTGNVLVSPAVLDEVAEGKAHGVDLPDLSCLSWIEVRSPVSALAQPLVTDLGPGETQVLMLALETPKSIVILDDRLARRIAEVRGIPVIGTLGLLLNAKRAGIIKEVKPSLDRLQNLSFRLSAQTRAAVLELAGEIESGP
jgi:predicted nucleic acid-binding protein